MSKDINAKIMAQTASVEEQLELTIERKLLALYSMQLVDSQIDKIRSIRGELPLEVQDLEDEIAGLETRIEKFENEANLLNQGILEKKYAIKESLALIKRYEEQQMNVRNNREYDSLSKEVEYQTLEIQLSEKRTREYTSRIEELNKEIEVARLKLNEKTADLEVKRSELHSIVEETEKEELELSAKTKSFEDQVEERLLIAYKRIRSNARNGLAVVQIKRDACGGCFNKIPPQHQLDIRMHKKVIVCEYCGRILVDNTVASKASI